MFKYISGTCLGGYGFRSAPTYLEAVLLSSI
jgi:hypothetical protein